MFSIWVNRILTLSILRKEMGLAEEEGGLPVLDADNLNIFFPQLPKLSPCSFKIGTNLPVAWGLMRELTSDHLHIARSSLQVLKVQRFPSLYGVT